MKNFLIALARYVYGPLRGACSALIGCAVATRSPYCLYISCSSLFGVMRRGNASGTDLRKPRYADPSISVFCTPISARVMRDRISMPFPSLLQYTKDFRVPQILGLYLFSDKNMACVNETWGKEQGQVFHRPSSGSGMASRRIGYCLAFGRRDRSRSNVRGKITICPPLLRYPSFSGTATEFLFFQFMLLCRGFSKAIAL